MFLFHAVSRIFMTKRGVKKINSYNIASLINIISCLYPSPFSMLFNAHSQSISALFQKKKKKKKKKRKKLPRRLSQISYSIQKLHHGLHLGSAALFSTYSSRSVMRTMRPRVLLIRPRVGKPGISGGCL